MLGGGSAVLRAAGVDDHEPAAPGPSASMRPGQSGAVARLPLDSKGLAPSITSMSVRSTSGTGTVSDPPNISPAATSLGRWSTVLAE